MPNIKSAKKRVKVIEKKTLRNNMIKSAYKTAVKNFEQAVEKAVLNGIADSLGDDDFLVAQIQRFCQTFGVVHAAHDVVQPRRSAIQSDVLIRRSRMHARVLVRFFDKQQRQRRLARKILRSQKSAQILLADLFQDVVFGVVQKSPLRRQNVNVHALLVSGGGDGASGGTVKAVRRP